MQKFLIVEFYSMHIPDNIVALTVNVARFKKRNGIFAANSRFFFFFFFFAFFNVPSFHLKAGHSDDTTLSHLGPRIIQESCMIIQRILKRSFKNLA